MFWADGFWATGFWAEGFWRETGGGAGEDNAVVGALTRRRHRRKIRL